MGRPRYCRVTPDDFEALHRLGVAEKRNREQRLKQWEANRDKVLAEWERNREQQLKQWEATRDNVLAEWEHNRPELDFNTL